MESPLLNKRLKPTCEISSKLEAARNRCDEHEGLFGGRQFAPHVTDILVVVKRDEL